MIWGEVPLFLENIHKNPMANCRFTKKSNPTISLIFGDMKWICRFPKNYYTCQESFHKADSCGLQNLGRTQKSHGVLCWTKRKRPKNIENWLLAKHAKTTWELKSWKWVTLPETNSLHLKMDGWKGGFLLGWLPGRCYVSFRVYLLWKSFHVPC